MMYDFQDKFPKIYKNLKKSINTTMNLCVCFIFKPNLELCCTYATKSEYSENDH